MKKILIILLITISINSLAQESRNIKDEVESFIDIVKYKSNDFLDKHTVYVLYIYKEDSVLGNYSCGMSYIINDSDYGRVKPPNYYINFGKDVVLVCLFDDVKEKEVRVLGLKRLDKIKREEILKRLLLGDVTFVTGRFEGMQCYFEKGRQAKRVFYDDVGTVPYKGFIGTPVNSVKVDLMYEELLYR